MRRICSCARIADSWSGLSCMNLAATAFCVDTAQTAHELIDGEVVVIHLRRGAYHSLNPTAAWLWAELLHGATEAQLAQRLQTLAAAPTPTELAVVAADFLQALQQAELLKPGLPPLASPSLPAPQPEAYSPPRIETYTDMEALLLLDPVHEVDAAGWPKRPDHSA